METSSKAARPRELELWGSVECTVNRVGDAWYSQLERNGHADRADDLDRFAQLGIRALRYPVLWERTAPNGLEHARWDWPDQRLARLREIEIVPIVGLSIMAAARRVQTLPTLRFRKSSRLMQVPWQRAIRGSSTTRRSASR